MLSITRILPFVPICLSGFIYAVFRFLLLLYIFRVQYNTSVLMGHRLSFEVSDTQHKSISFPRCTEHHGFQADICSLGSSLFMQCLAYRVDVAKQLDCVSGYPRLESSYIVTK
ncbi:hypothetical protein AcV5_010402 [Taiwanofungus camphoratus]|nr:hypothetical protein AcV5_010402 [Antrodia cinnamomea]